MDDAIDPFFRSRPLPPGHLYMFVSISLIKRVLAEDIPAEYRLKFLEYLDKMTAYESSASWLNADMIAAIEPMDDRGYELVQEAQKLGPSKALDTYAKFFWTFAGLNPSLISALKMSPAYRGLANEASACSPEPSSAPRPRVPAAPPWVMDMMR